MKSLIALILCLVLVAISGSVLAGEYRRPYVATDKEELYGTWVNMDYGTYGRYYQKIIIKPDGTEEDFRSGTIGASIMGRYLITRKWSDQKGNIWYKYHWVRRSSVGEGLNLIKISNSGNTLEYVQDTREYPTEIDPEHDWYRIYYRK